MSNFKRAPISGSRAARKDPLASLKMAEIVASTKPLLPAGMPKLSSDWAMEGTWKELFIGELMFVVSRDPCGGGRLPGGTGSDSVREGVETDARDGV
jgi:hypothetical protein